MLRSALDRLYTSAGWLAAANLVGILLMVAAGILGRLIGFQLAGADAYAGYCMAACGFLGMAHTLQRGEHIRVNLLLARAGVRVRRLLDLAAHLLGCILCCGLAVYATRLTWFSHAFGDVSQAIDATPLWIVQLSMAAGTWLLTIAMLDASWQLLAPPTGRSEPAAAQNPAEASD